MVKNNRISFCFITGLYGRYDGLIFERQGKSLVEAGFNVTIVVSDTKPNEVKNGIKIISTGKAFKNRKERFIQSKNELISTALKVDADVYQISDPELLGQVSFFKKRRKIVVFNLREYYPDLIEKSYYIPKRFRSIVSFFYTKYMIHYLAKYDVVFTVTDWILDVLKSNYHLNNVYLLANFPRYNLSHDFPLEEYMERKNILCYEGTVYKNSRQENVFDALIDIPDLKYVVIGKIHPNYEYIKNHPYWKKIEFKDGFNLTDLEFTFKRSTISNVFRDFGKRDGSLGVMKVFESMEAGLPVLFADVPLYQRINKKYNCGICVDPNNIESIKKALEFLINNKEEAYEMGKRGRFAIKEEYNWEKQAAFFVSTIIKLCDDHE